MRDPEDEIRASGQKKYAIVELERNGNKFIMRVLGNESDAFFITVGEHEMKDIPGEVLAGIFICSHNAAVIETANISNVQIK